MGIDADFPGNSNKKKQEATAKEPDDKQVKKVIQGDVVRRKKSLSKRFSETFTGADTKTVADYVVFEVAIPAFKDLMFDVFTQGFERKLFGEVRSSGARRRPSNTTGGYVSYNQFSSGSPGGREDPRETRGMSRRSRSRHNFDDILIATRAEGNDVIDSLFALVSQYGVATVRDLYDLVGETAHYTDEKYGWTNLRGSDVRRTRDGYLLDLPKPEQLD